jgi:hypothetical protein
MRTGEGERREGRRGMRREDEDVREGGRRVRREKVRM